MAFSHVPRDRQDLPLVENLASESEEDSGGIIDGPTSGCVKHLQSYTWKDVLCRASCAILIPVAIIAGTFVYRDQSQQPTWEVINLTITEFHLSGLKIKGVAAADTSNCSLEDPCGVASHKGCSKCPRPEMWNDGCICRENANGRSAPSGEIISANTATCPTSDQCGLGEFKGCSTCPDSSWINEGCSCRQPLSAKQFVEGFENFFGAVKTTLVGMDRTVMKMNLVVETMIHNPASVGATAQGGIMNIQYRGQVIGAAAIQPISIGPKGSALLTADVAVDKVPEQIGMRMLQDILSSNFQLPIQIDGSALAICGPLQVHCIVHCDLLTDVSALPAAEFSRKSCTYNYAV